MVIIAHISIYVASWLMTTDHSLSTALRSNQWFEIKLTKNTCMTNNVKEVRVAKRVSWRGEVCVWDARSERTLQHVTMLKELTLNETVERDESGILKKLFRLISNLCLLQLERVIYVPGSPCFMAGHDRYYSLFTYLLTTTQVIMRQAMASRKATIEALMITVKEKKQKLQINEQ